MLGLGREGNSALRAVAARRCQLQADPTTHNPPLVLLGGGCFSPVFCTPVSLISFRPSSFLCRVFLQALFTTDITALDGVCGRKWKQEANGENHCFHHIFPRSFSQFPSHPVLFLFHMSHISFPLRCHRTSQDPTCCIPQVAPSSNESILNLSLIIY